ncbi:negative regulator of sigma E activity [Bradyrhizobium sp. i1.3.6]
MISMQKFEGYLTRLPVAAVAAYVALVVYVRVHDSADRDRDPG